MVRVGAPLKKKVVLLVEDSPGDVRLIQEIFATNASDTELVVASDGATALEMLEAFWPSLILLDLNLPGIDGRVVLKTIKNSEALRRIPVVVLSTSSSETDINDAYAAHANCYVAKPMDFTDFAKVIANIEAYWLHSYVLEPTQYD